jgi:chromosome segregation ATPase
MQSTADAFRRLLRINGPDWEHTGRFQRAVQALDGLQSEIEKQAELIASLRWDIEVLTKRATDAERAVHVVTVERDSMQSNVELIRHERDAARALVANVGDALAKGLKAAEALAGAPGPAQRVALGESAVAALRAALKGIGR